MTVLTPANVFAPGREPPKSEIIQLLNSIIASLASFSPLAFVFDVATADADPGTGKFRLNNVDPAAATAAYFDNVNQAGVTVSAVLDGWDGSTSTAKGQLLLTKASDPSVFHAYSVGGPVVDGTGYRKLTMTHVGGGGAFAADDVVLAQFLPTGDVGTGALAYDSEAAFVSADIPISFENAEYVENGVRHDVFSIGTPSVVEPWHVAADNGRYWEQRFPDGKVDVKRLGAVGVLDPADLADDTEALAAAFDYCNRAWWTGGANPEARLRGSIYAPPGIYGIDPTTPLQMFDYMRLEGAGRGSTMFKPTTTGAGKLLDHYFSDSGVGNTRATHIEIRGIRLILTGENQIMVDARHCGRGLIEHVEVTSMDHHDQYYNGTLNGTATLKSGTRGIVLATDETLMVGGDGFTIRDTFIYYCEYGIQGGYGSGLRTPEHVGIIDSEVSNCFYPIVFGGDYGGALCGVKNTKVQRWGPNANGEPDYTDEGVYSPGARPQFNTGNVRAIDTNGRSNIIGAGNYFETKGNTAAPVLFRTGSERCFIDTRQNINYTATATAAHNAAELVTDDGTGSIIL